MFKKEWKNIPHEIKKLFWLSVYKEKSDALNSLNSDDVPNLDNIIKFNNSAGRYRNLRNYERTKFIKKLKRLI